MGGRHLGHYVEEMAYVTVVVHVYLVHYYKNYQ